MWCEEGTGLRPCVLRVGKRCLEFEYLPLPLCYIVQETFRHRDCMTLGSKLPSQLLSFPALLARQRLYVKPTSACWFETAALQPPCRFPWVGVGCQGAAKRWVSIVHIHAAAPKLSPATEANRALTLLFLSMTGGFGVSKLSPLQLGVGGRVRKQGHPLSSLWRNRGAGFCCSMQRALTLNPIALNPQEQPHFGHPRQRGRFPREILARTNQLPGLKRSGHVGCPSASFLF